MKSHKTVINNNSRGGIGFCSALALIFITLKLCGVINWGWIWVLSPLWIPLLTVCVLLFMFVLIIGCIGVGFALTKYWTR